MRRPVGKPFSLSLSHLQLLVELLEAEVGDGLPCEAELLGHGRRDAQLHQQEKGPENGLPRASHSFIVLLFFPACFSVLFWRFLGSSIGLREFRGAVCQGNQC
ncbi:hypothetical protein LX32DRAFT_172756 [Colletotrichum zoysiae]|uniref:Uncharacterized protein n=1 Tax=Colletotrichum zoysiae TaxID=1216348 RepID=A0AAD9H704_9PEZI|nr:hypothetical protein LX32DRAFT_172756 [Colletotrichum zoysiae]